MNATNKKEKDETALTARKLAQTPPPYGTAERESIGAKGEGKFPFVLGFFFTDKLAPPLSSS
jgi:hypothetical protein